MSILTILRWANLTVAFMLELWALGALGYWGFQTGNGLLMKLLLGIGAPLIAAVAWGLFVAPKASIPVPSPVRLLIELAVFGAAAAGLWQRDHATMAIALLVILVVNHGLIYLLEQGA